MVIYVVMTPAHSVKKGMFVDLWGSLMHVQTVEHETYGGPCVRLSLTGGAGKTSVLAPITVDVGIITHEIPTDGRKYRQLASLHYYDAYQAAVRRTETVTAKAPVTYVIQREGDFGYEKDSTGAIITFDEKKHARTFVREMRDYQPRVVRHIVELTGLPASV